MFRVCKVFLLKGRALVIRLFSVCRSNANNNFKRNDFFIFLKNNVSFLDSSFNSCLNRATCPNKSSMNAY
uniref:Putative secreted protein n=1 Tax=Ixodes ricinus TaxID=34613 RepID=A0A6B0U274_IXORI